jgi:hypothetical protein
MRDEFMITRQGKLCDCGCGLPAPIATRNDASKGYVKGEPMRFVRGHATRRNVPDFVVTADGCWVWQRGLNPVSGYGQMSSGEYAHRTMYRKHKGEIPEGMQIDHLCRVRACINPDHLEVVTRSENARRGLAGRHPKVAARRLTDAQVREIRTSKQSNRTLANQYRVSHETIRCIKNGRHYAEVA